LTPNNNHQPIVRVLRVRTKLVIVTPYYEDVASNQFCIQLGEVIDQDSRVIIVDDGSVNTPFDSKQLSNAGLKGRVLYLKRNIGHQAAIAVGLNYALDNYDFEHLVTMDSDGEDKPASIKSLIAKLKSKNVDIAVASRKSRVETKRFKLFYLLYKMLFRLLVGHHIGFGNFIAFNKSAARRLSVSYETRIHLAASVLNSKLRVLECSIDRGKRYAGQSQMNMVSLLLHGLRSIMVFAESVLVRITAFSAVCAGLIIVAMITMILFKLTGLAIPGWFSTLGGILLLLLFQVAIMALLVLLLAGSLRSQSVEPINHSEFIEEVIEVNA